MTADTQLALRLKHLLGGVSDQGIAHLVEVETDLVQTTLLLTEAIEKLSVSFMAIHEAANAQQEVIDLLVNGAAPQPELGARLEAIRLEIGRHVNAAVTGMQFQDMTNQLIDRSRNHLACMRDVLSVLSDTAAKITLDGIAPKLASLLGETNIAIEQRSVSLEDALRKAVSQTHMESGDIELF